MDISSASSFLLSSSFFLFHPHFLPASPTLSRLTFFFLLSFSTRPRSRTLNVSRWTSRSVGRKFHPLGRLSFRFRDRPSRPCHSVQPSVQPSERSVANGEGKTRERRGSMIYRGPKKTKTYRESGLSIEPSRIVHPREFKGKKGKSVLAIGQRGKKELVDRAKSRRIAIDVRRVRLPTYLPTYASNGRYACKRRNVESKIYP